MSSNPFKAEPVETRQALNRIGLRARNLERRVPAGDWIYVGSYPVDEHTTIDSPPWQNGWANTGTGTPDSDELTKFRWKIGLGASIDLVVNATGGDSGTVMFTLPADYWPAVGKQTIDCTDSDGQFTCVTVVPRTDGSNMADVYQGRI